MEEQLSYLLPAFPQRNVPIVLASSAYYAPYLAVTIQSIIQSGSQENNYDIIVLHREISKEDQENIQELARGHHNVLIRFHVPEDKILQANFNFRQDSAAALESFYCVVLAEILPAYDKALVMDCDVIVRHDAAELYAVNLDRYMIAAARDPDGIGNAYADAAQAKYETIMQGRSTYMLEKMGLKRLEDYFQSGVMVLNLSEFRKRYTLAQITDVACAEFIMFGDQDTMNILCKGHVRYIDMSWNFVVNYHDIQLGSLREYGPRRVLDEYYEARKAPKIIHYAGIKPWKAIDVEFSQCFWETAAKTPYFGVIFERCRTSGEKTDYEAAEQCKDHLVTLYLQRQVGLRYIKKLLKAWWQGKRNHAILQQETAPTPALSGETPLGQAERPMCFDGAQPLVSVIVPCRNVQYYLRPCLNSILRQSMGNLEIIVLDNNSDDDTAKVIAEYADHFSNIRPIYLEKDCGPSGARNKGMKCARGKYIAFCDADDTLPEGAYMALTKAAEKFGADIVVGDFLRVYPDGGRKGDNLDGNDPFANCLMCGVVWNKLLRRRFVEEHNFRFDPSIAHFEDLLFVAKLLQSGPRIITERDIVYYHLESRGTDNHEQLTSRVTYQRTWSLVHMLEEVFAVPLAGNLACWSRFYRDMLQVLYRQLWSCLRDPEDLRKGYSLLRDAIAIGERTGVCDWSEPENGWIFKDIFYLMPTVFKSMTFESYMLFLALREDKPGRQEAAPQYEDPRKKTLLLFYQGEVGFRYIIKYVKAWLSYKLKRGKS